jgi:hypothetical protein
MVHPRAVVAEGFSRALPQLLKTRRLLQFVSIVLLVLWSRDVTDC